MPRRDDIYLKSLYFAIWTAVGAFWPYIYVYYRSDIGLTGTQIGMVVMISSLMGMLSATAWGMLNDRLGRTRLLLSIQSLALIVVCLALSQIHSFTGILIASGLFSVFASPIMPLLDSTTLNILGARRDHYGVYRAWGTIGFVVTCTAVGFVIERTGMRLIFPVYAAGVLAFWLLALRLPNRPVVRGPSRLAGLSQMVRRPAWLIFAISVFILWFSVMGAFAFLGIVVVEMGGTQRMVGLAATIAALTEIPMFHYSSRLLRRFGPARLLIVAMSVYAFRLAALRDHAICDLGARPGDAARVFLRPLPGLGGRVRERFGAGRAEIDRARADGVGDEPGEPHGGTGGRLVARQQRPAGPLLQHDGDEPARAGHFRAGMGERTPPRASARVTGRELVG